MAEVLKDQAPQEKQAAKPKFNIFSLSTWKVVSSAFREGLNKKSGHQLNFRIVNTCLMGCFMVLFFYFIHDVFSSMNKIRGASFRMSKITGSEGRQAALSGLKEAAYYVDKIKLRDIFKMGGKAVAEAAEVISSRAAEATKDLRLVGISWSDHPDAMVENTKLQKTFFVKKGQMIGDVKVESIAQDKIVLRYGEELIDLR